MADGFRRGAQQFINNRNNGGGTGRRPNWRMKWKPPHKPTDSGRQVAEPMVFIPGSYENSFWDKDSTPPAVVKRIDFYFQGRKHIFKMGPKNIKEIICSAGPNPHAPLPCVGDFEVDHGGAKGAQAKDFYAFNIAHLAMYHLVPIENKERPGTFVYKKDSNGNQTQELLLVEEQCTMQGCHRCQQMAQAQQNYYPLKWGAQRIFEVGTGHFQTLLAFHDKVGMFCANCMTNIKLLGYYCAHCTNDVLVKADPHWASWTDDQIDKLVKKPVRCTTCGVEDILEENIDCGYEPQGSWKMQGKGCSTDVAPRRLSLFDVVFYLQREGVDAQTKIVDATWMPKTSYQTPDGRPLEDHIKEIVKSPFNFIGFYDPGSTEEQSRQLGKPNPFGQQMMYQQQAPQQPGYGPPQQGYGPSQQQQQAPQGYPGYAPPGAPMYPNVPVPGRPIWK